MLVDFSELNTKEMIENRKPLDKFERNSKQLGHLDCLEKGEIINED